MHTHPYPHCTEHFIRSVHQIEIELTPHAYDVYFRDERYIDPILSQIRFNAMVYNAPTNAIKWELVTPDGNQGAGTLTQDGLYTAPLKTGALHHGQTEIIIASPCDDPSRRATALITLLGNGPEEPPEPSIELYPKNVNLYYYNDKSYPAYYNQYIDFSNKCQQFNTVIRNTGSTSVAWDISPAGIGSISGSGFYKAPGDGSNRQKVTVTATLSTLSGFKKAQAVVLLHNYAWPGIDKNMQK